MNSHNDGLSFLMSQPVKIVHYDERSQRIESWRWLIKDNDLRITDELKGYGGSLFLASRNAFYYLTSY